MSPISSLLCMTILHVSSNSFLPFLASFVVVVKFIDIHTDKIQLLYDYRCILQVFFQRVIFWTQRHKNLIW